MENFDIKSKKLLVIILILFLLIVCVIITYHQMINFNFVGYDDEIYITENKHMKEGVTLKGAAWALTTFHGSNWHPITWISHMLDCELYCLNPSGHHLTNLQLHILNTLLLFLLLKNMTGAVWKSAFVASLFGLHPLHVESVAWVAERKDLLSAFFGFLTMGMYYRYTLKLSFNNYLWILFFFILGLMSKPMLVTLPFVFLLLDIWPLKRFKYNYLMSKKKQKIHFPLDGESLNKSLPLGGGGAEPGPYLIRGWGGVLSDNLKLFWEKIPFFIFTCLSCIITFIAQNSTGAVRPLAEIPLVIRIGNSFVSYVKYIIKTLWPDSLAVFYPHPGNNLPILEVGSSMALIAIITWLSIRALKQYPFIAVGWFWFIGMLVPVIGIVQVGQQAMADRYTYLPAIGIFIIAAWGVPELCRKINHYKAVLAVMAITVLIFLSIVSFFQVKHWKDGKALFEHAIKVTKGNWLAHADLGVILSLEGKTNEALYNYEKATEFNPNDSGSYYNMGIILQDKNLIDKAIMSYKNALILNPEYADAHNNLANLLKSKGKIDEAVFHYKEAIKYNPEHAGAHNNYAAALAIQGKYGEAITHYLEAIHMKPEDPIFHFNFGNFLLANKRYKEAIVQFCEAIKVDPGYAPAYNQIGVILASQGKDNKAKIFFKKAIELEKENKNVNKPDKIENIPQ